MWEPNVKIEAIGLDGKTTCASCGLTRNISYVVEEDDEPLAYIGVNCYDDRISSLNDFILDIYTLSSNLFTEIQSVKKRTEFSLMNMIDDAYLKVDNQRRMIEFLEKRKRR